MSLPVAVTLSQPLFSVNHLKWNRRIEPLRYREAQARFLTETEQVAMQAINLYFGLLLAGEQVNIARQNRIQQLFNYWYYYYQLRSIALWDFERGCELSADLERLCRE